MKKSDRKIIYNKFNGHCAYCGEVLQKGWHVDELLPVKRYWKWKLDKYGQPMFSKKLVKIKEWFMEHPERLTLENQMPACPSCNINKHSMSLEDFRTLITNFPNSLNKTSVQYKVAKRYGLIEETDMVVEFYFETFL